MHSTISNQKISQTWNAEAYAANGRFVATLASDVLALLNPQPGEKILDLGPIEATAKHRKTIPISPVAGGAAVVAGVALVIAGTKRT